jgi:periplasmic divalent cation tolerance protein
MISIYTTCKNKKEAKKIADILLKKRLIACANFFPVESRYWWKGKLASGKEYALLMKSKGKAKEIVKEIEKAHSYNVPGISIEKIKTSKKTSKWIKREVK